MSTDRTTDPGSKSAAELEREVEAQRAEVEDNLDRLQDRLSPGQMMDQMFDYVRTGNGAKFTRNLGRSMRDNPIPLALMGVGMVWLMVSAPSDRSRHDDRFDRDWDDDRFDRGWDDDWNRDNWDWDDRFADDEDDSSGDPVAFGMTPQARGGTAPANSDDKGVMAKAGEVAGDMAEGVKDRTVAAGQQVGRNLRNAGEMASRHGRNLRRGARLYRDRFGRSIDRYGRRARRGFLDSLEEQPLVLGAIGVAVGAALGAALSATEREDELMGETRDRIKRQAEKEGRNRGKKARDMADAAYGAAKEEVDRQGLNQETGQPVADDLKDKATKVADAAKKAAEEEHAKRS